MSGEYVIGVGHCTVDYLGLLPRYPDRDEKVELAEFSQQGGGPTATALATLACFGAPTRFVGKVSDDPFGQFISTGLERLGVDLSQLIVEPDRVSPFSFSAVEMSNGLRTIFCTQGSVTGLSPEDIDVDAVLDNAAVLLVDGIHVDAQTKVAEEAHRRGIKVVMDGGSVREGSGDLMEMSDVLIASERFATDMAAAPELDQSLTELHKLGPKTCVITLGSDGAIGLDEHGKRHREPAYKVDVKDTTGAGDVYHGAYIYGVLKGWDLPRTMHFASVTAALKCRHLGGRAGIPELQEVLAIIDAKD